MKLKNFLKRIPRPLQAIVCTILVLVLAAAYYIALGCPTLTLQQEFRRAEKIHMVGPSTIMDTLSESEYPEFHTMIVGETDYGICFFGKRENIIVGDDEPWYYLFHYKEKTGDFTLAVAPNYTSRMWQFPGESLPVYIFLDDSNASRAELHIQITGKYSWVENGEHKELQFNEIFTQTVDKTDPTFFRFLLTATNESECRALSVLSNVETTVALSADEKNAVITATIRLFDSSNKLITSKFLSIGPQNTK